jgi:hypothetical protein
VLPNRAEAVATVAALARQFEDVTFTGIVHVILEREPSGLDAAPKDGLH